MNLLKYGSDRSGEVARDTTFDRPISKFEPTIYMEDEDHEYPSCCFPAVPGRRSVHRRGRNRTGSPRSSRTRRQHSVQLHRDSVGYEYFYTNPENFIGFPDDLGRRFHLDVVNAACPGETTGSFLSSTAPDYGCRAYRNLYPLHADYKSTQLEFRHDVLEESSRGAPRDDHAGRERRVLARGILCLESQPRTVHP